MNTFKTEITLDVPNGKTNGEVREFLDEILGGFGFSDKYLTNRICLQHYDIGPILLQPTEGEPQPQRFGRDFVNAQNLYVTAKALYDRLIDMTTHDFSKGGDKVERDELAKILTVIDGQKRD